MKTQKIVLSIAGSDNTGGAGIQADLKTCCAFGVYGATVITGVTAQNSRKVFGVEPVSLSMLDDQMVATNGGSLVAPGNDTVEAFIEYLLPLATVMTPNISEASVFLHSDTSEMDPHAACELLLEKTGTHAVLLKGGHSSTDIAADYLFDGDTFTAFKSQKIETPNTHGTGCTLSSAIACGLAKGESLTEAISNAKIFIDKAIASAADLQVMNGPGPLDFFV